MTVEEKRNIIFSLEATKIFDQSNNLWHVERLLRKRSHWSNRARTAIGLAEVDKLSAMLPIEKIAQLNSEIKKLLDL